MHRELHINDVVSVSLPTSKQPRSSSQPWIMAFYVAPNARNAEQNVRYLKRLAQHVYPVSTLFMVILAGPKVGQDMLTYSNKESSNVWFASADDVPGIANSFFNASTGVMLLDPSGRVRFVTYDFVEPNDLKLLVGRYFQHYLPYTTNSLKTLLKLNNTWPDFQAFSINSNNFVLLTPTSQTYVTFTARCTECTLPGFIADFKSYLELKHPNPPPILVFSSTFDLNLIASLCRGIHVPIYQAMESIPGIEDPDTLDMYAPSEVMVVQCNGRKIVNFQGWDSFVKEVKKAS